jgi:hypothetical protein
MKKAINVELYRFKKSRYPWIILFLSALMMIETVFVTCEDYHSYLEDSVALENLKATFQQVNWGIYLGSVMPEWCEAQVIPITELFMRNIQSKVLLMFQTVFVVLFIGEEIRNNFQKNLSAVFPKKIQQIVGKIFVISIFCAMIYFSNFLVMLLSFYIHEGYIVMTDVMPFVKYMITEYILYVAYSIAIMFVAYIIRNSAVCLLVGILEAAGILQVVDVLLQSIGVFSKSFSIMKYIVSGNIVLLAINSSSAEYVCAFMIAILFVILAIVGTSNILEKRDIY